MNGDGGFFVPFAKRKEMTRGRETAAFRLASSSGVLALCPVLLEPLQGNGKGLPGGRLVWGYTLPGCLVVTQGIQRCRFQGVIAGGGSDRSWCF